MRLARFALLLAVFTAARYGMWIAAVGVVALIVLGKLDGWLDRCASTGKRVGQWPGLSARVSSAAPKNKLGC